MGSKRVCPRCGRLTDEFIGPLCKDCYVKEYGVAQIPSQITFTYCKLCGAYKYQGRWYPGLGTIKDTLKEYIFIMLTNKIKPTQYIEEAWIKDVELLEEKDTNSLKTVRALIEVKGRSGNVEVSERKIVNVILSPTLCPRCLSKRSKSGFEAIIQIRGLMERLDDKLKNIIMNFIKNEIEPKFKDSIIEVKNVKEGLDMTVYDQVSAKMIISRVRKYFPVKVIESYKVVGRKPNGKRKSRVTFSVRVFDAEPGDIIILNESNPLLFLRMSRRNLEFLNMNTGKTFILPFEDMWRYNLKKFKGEERFEIIRKKLLLLSKNSFSTVFLDADRNYQDYLEYPSSNVFYPFGSLIEGNEYEAYIFRNRVFIRPLKSK
jgi:nonsense-mediated mRNA decay protein 3